MASLIYKICPERLWREAEALGRFDGAEAHRRDGYIHFSTAEQVRDTAAKHFAGEADLLLIAVDATRLSALRYEPAGRGTLFPHLYAPLSLAAVVSVTPLPFSSDGAHLFPPDIP